ncbi:MAG: helix-turn-helix transcriptional regulator [Rhodospirillales bacterium]|nr:helix-turn-helix transcriptional regulator [Rhodospirillales bacterium]
MTNFSLISKRSTTDLDRYMGQKLKTLRSFKGISQSDLAEYMGLSFQQIQKYENGKNRISAASLFHIAKILDANVTDFFPEESGQKEEDTLSDILLDKNIVELVRLYGQLPDDDRKKSVQQFIRLFLKIQDTE